jgi:hypothetical protein
VIVFSGLLRIKQCRIFTIFLVAHRVGLRMTSENNPMIIPIMPCQDIRTQVAFYEILGFTVLGIYTSPNPYASLKWKTLELHFYGSRKVDPIRNSTMCYLRVEDVDDTYMAFTKGLKEHTGQVARTGLPRISKVRDLVDDRRFTLTDPGGNTIFIGSAVNKKGRFFRTLQDEKHAKKFSALYDVLYSKEDPALALSMLPTFSVMSDQLSGLDKAKFLLLWLDIRKQSGQETDDDELKKLIRTSDDRSDDWANVKARYFEINRG